MNWINIYNSFILNKSLQLKKIEKLYLISLLSELKQHFQISFGPESEYKNSFMNKAFVESFLSVEEKDFILNDNINPFFLDSNNIRNKKLVLNNVNFFEKNTSLHWLLKNNIKFELNSFHKIIELNKGRHWLSNILIDKNVLFLFGSLIAIPTKFRFFYKHIDLTTGERTRISVGILNQKKKQQKNKTLLTCFNFENSISEIPLNGVLIEFSTHLPSNNSAEIIIPVKLFLEKGGQYTNIFYNQVKMNQVKGTDVDNLLKTSLKSINIYKNNNNSVKTETYLKKIDKSNLLLFDPILRYNVDYIKNVSEDWLIWKLIAFEKFFLFSYLKYIYETESWVNSQNILNIKEYSPKYIHIRNTAKELKSRIILNSQISYEFYKRHKIYKDKINFPC